MRSTFFGLEAARKGLLAHQKMIDVTGHNIANANTPGYSRQVAIAATTEPFTEPTMNRVETAGQIGTGVDIKSILRIRDAFTDLQIRAENHTYGKWEARQEILSQLEMIVGEPSDTNSLRNTLDVFWQSLQELAKRPEEQAVRSTVRQQGIILAETIRHTYTQMQDLMINIEAEIKVGVDHINSIAYRIAALNERIGKIVAIGDEPNDLLDQRDYLIDELSKLVDINIVEDHQRKAQITIGGKSLVIADKVNEIHTDINVSSGLSLKWPDWTEVFVKNGKVKGFLEVREDDIPYLLEKLDEFANTLIHSFNTVHRAGIGLDGSTNIDFFAGSTARDIQVHNDIILDLRKIAASRSGAPGDGDNALAMADLKHQRVLSSNTATFADFIGGIVSKIGVDSSRAQSMLDNQKVLLSHLENRRESYSGVSIDEEMAEMIRFQHGFNAAAKVIATVDEMLEVIVKGLKV